MSLEQALNYLVEIKHSKGRNNKIHIFSEGDFLLKSIIRIGVDPFIIFNKKFYLSEIDNVSKEDRIKAVSYIKEFLYSISTNPRSICLDDSKELESQLSILYSTESVRFREGVSIFIDILNKTPRIGIAGSAFEKLHPGEVKWFSVQLCGRYNSYGDLNGCFFNETGVISNSYIIEPKYDGQRVILIPHKDIAISRNGKPVYGMSKILSTLRERESKFKGRKFIFDGELYLGSWEDSVSVAHSNVNPREDINAKVYLFDILFYEEFIEQECSVKLKTRKKYLNQFMSKLQDSSVYQVPYHEVLCEQDVDRYLKKFIREGYEGAVLKENDSFYEYGRGDSWLKVVIDNKDEFPIVEICTAESGKFSGTCNSLIVP